MSPPRLSPRHEISYDTSAAPGLLLAVERVSLTVPVVLGGLVLLLALTGVACWVLNSQHRTNRLAHLIRAIRRK